MCCGLFAISFSAQWAVLGFWGFFIFVQVTDLEKEPPFEDAKG
jgi:hypothetical protein